MKKDQTQSKTDFNHYADDYEKLLKESTKMSGFKPDYFDEQKIKTLYKDFNSSVKNEGDLNILNFGCGIGKSEKFIVKYFKNCKLISVDVSKRSIEIAKEVNKEFKNIEFISFDKIEDLKLETKFDIIFIANVFHHIPEELHVHILKHLRSFLSSDGYLYVFEHNPINPLTRKVFETCEFDVGCKMISVSLFVSMCKDARYKTIRSNYILFFPKFFSMFIGLEKFLKWCPLGAQYYIKAK